MNKLKYLLHCACRMDFSAMRAVLRQVQKASGKPKWLLLADMLHCGVRYQAGYNDYRDFDFYCRNHMQRKTCLTRGKNNAIVRRYNDKAYFGLFEDKGAFCKRFAPFLRRDWLDLRTADNAALEAFLERHPTFFAKPVGGMGGKGVEHYTHFSADLRAVLARKGQELLEEPIIQHPALASLNPWSVNTLRLFTFFDGRKAHLVQSVLKIGGTKSPLDNFSSGGMFTFTDPSGRVLYPAVDQNDQVFERHPLTGAEIVGFQVPCMAEAVALVYEAAAVAPQVRYVGWDVAIGAQGPLIVEGNAFPGVFEPKARFLHGEPGSLAVYRRYMKI